ncbi:hypothetical protein DFJ43DRAFT_1035341 [Lentinula guzmanii]|uniref:Uncharacterized protein n=1 Tax=Lentinula guzmanii TaxID=2804957 RepID=A0AA38JKM4_9AGAR|nr:hypothetical protein DFJ43DRAFT_1035341 [Lentinula guzmanii]
MDAQRLVLEEAQNLASVAQLSAAAKMPIPSDTPQFVGQTSLGTVQSKSVSSLRSLLSSPPPTHIGIPSSEGSQTFPSLPMSPLRVSEPSSRSRSNPSLVGAGSVFDHDLPAQPPNPANPDPDSEGSHSERIVPVVRPRMRQGEIRLKASSKTTEISKAIAELTDYIDEEVKRIAAENKKSLLYVKKALGVHRRFREKKTASLYNALMHRLSQQYRAKNIRMGASMNDKHNAMSRDAETQAILANPKGRKAQEALDDLREYSLAKISGARSSSKANENDIVKTWGELTRKAQNLSKRTSAATFGFICSSKSGQNVTRSFFGNGPIEGFLMSKFGITGAEFVESAEAYCILTSTGRTATGTSVKKMKQEIIQTISNGLRNITKNDKLKMEYEHYEVLIVKEYGVRLVGWPENVPMCSPYTLHAASIVTLYQVLNTRECHWKLIDAMELRRVRKDIEARMANGDLAVPEQLQRTGKKRGAPKDTEGSDRPQKKSKRVSRSGGHPRTEGKKDKKLKKTGLKPQSRKQVILSEDEDEDEGDDGEGEDMGDGDGDDDDNEVTVTSWQARDDEGEEGPDVDIDDGTFDDVWGSDFWGFNDSRDIDEQGDFNEFEDLDDLDELDELNEDE